MDIESVIEFMRFAPKRYKTIRTTVHYCGNGTVIKALREQYLGRDKNKGETGSSTDSSGKTQHSEPDGPFGWRGRIWYAGLRLHGGGRYRLELELPRSIHPESGTDIRAWDGRIVGPSGTETVMNSRVGGSSTEDDPLWFVVAQDSFWTTYLFDPDDIAGIPGVLRRLNFCVEGKTSRAGREAIQIKGVPTGNWEDVPEPLWWGADEYEILVDAERGVLLRCASRLNGKDFSALEVEEIYYDERFPEDVFTSKIPLQWG